jgi:hypothetical protein
MQRADGLWQLALRAEGRSLASASRCLRRTPFNRPQGIHHGIELHRLAARRRYPLQSECRLIGATARKPTRQNCAFFRDAQTRVSDDFERIRKHRLGRQQFFELGHAIARITVSARAWRAAWPACHEQLFRTWRPRTPAKHDAGPEVPAFQKFLHLRAMLRRSEATSSALSRCTKMPSYRTRSTPCAERINPPRARKGNARDVARPTAAHQ